MFSDCLNGSDHPTQVPDSESQRRTRTRPHPPLCLVLCNPCVSWTVDCTTFGICDFILEMQYSDMGVCFRVRNIFVLSVSALGSCPFYVLGFHCYILCLLFFFLPLLCSIQRLHSFVKSSSYRRRSCFFFGNATTPEIKHSVAERPPALFGR